MEFIHFSAGKDDEGRRLDKIVRTMLSQENLSGLYKALRSGLIKVNGKKQKGEYRISSGDDICIADFLTQKNNSSKKGEEKIQTNSPLPSEWIIFKNQSLLFINKPYDLSVQKSSPDEVSLNEFVQQDYDFFNSKKESLSFKTGPLHRLDRKTTGIIAFSQDLKGAQWFSQIVREHKIQKNYLALVEGTLKSPQLWTDRILKENDSHQKTKAFHTVKINSDDKNSKESITQALPLAYGTYKGKNVTLVKFNIKTGRTHQIRSSSAFHGHPLLGDTAYGGQKISGKQNLFLHAWTLILPENSLGIPQKIICPPGEIFVSILESCLIKLPQEL